MAEMTDRKKITREEGQGKRERQAERGREKESQLNQSIHSSPPTAWLRGVSATSQQAELIISAIILTL